LLSTQAFFWTPPKKLKPKITQGFEKNSLKMQKCTLFLKEIQVFLKKLKIFFWEKPTLQETLLASGFHFTCQKKSCSTS